MAKNILAEEGIRHKTDNYPIYLLSEDTYINKSTGRKNTIESTHATKCLCADCNKLFDIPRFDFKIYNRGRQYESYIDCGPDKDVKSEFEEISCPECGNKYFYSVLHKVHDPVREKGKINMHNAWVAPFSMRGHVLYNITDDNGNVSSINDSMDLSQIIIYPSGKRYEKRVNFTEVFDIENKNIYVTKSKVSPSGESEIIYKANSIDPLQSVSNMSFMRHVGGKLDRIGGHFRKLRCSSFMSPNDNAEKDLIGTLSSKSIRADANGYYDYKDYISHNKFEAMYHIRSSCTESIGPSYIYGGHAKLRINELGTDAFSTYYYGSSELYRVKRRAIESAFRNKFDISKTNEDVYLSSEKNRLYLESHSPNASEENTDISGHNVSAYCMFMVRYPAAFEYACQKTDEDLNARVTKTLRSKNIEVTEENINNLLSDLPDSAKGKAYRNNMFNVANQIYMSDKNVTKAVHDAKDSEEMIALMRYYAFGPDKLNDNIGEIKIPEHLKNKIYPSNELIQNDEELRAAFDKNPIGFANISYTAAKILRTDDKNLHYELTKALYKKTQSEPVPGEKDPKDFINVSRETIMAVNDPKIAAMMTKYAKIHGADKIAELYNNDKGYRHDISNFYICKDYMWKLDTANAEFVETPDPELLKKAVTIDEFKDIIVLREYLKSKMDDSSTQITDQKILKQACIDFVDRFGEKTPDMISRFANNINDRVYLTWNDGKALFEHNIIGFDENPDIVDCSDKGLEYVMKQYIYRRDRDPYNDYYDPKLQAKFDNADGKVINNMKFDMIRSNYDLARYNDLERSDTRPNPTEYNGRKIIFGITDTETKSPLCLFHYDIDNKKIGIETELDLNRDGSDPIKIAEAINIFTENLDISAFNSQKISSVPVSDRIPEEDIYSTTHRHKSWDPITGRPTNDGQPDIEADKRKELAAKIYGVDDNNNIKVPDIKIEVPGE